MDDDQTNAMQRTKIHISSQLVGGSATPTDYGHSINVHGGSTAKNQAAGAFQ